MAKKENLDRRAVVDQIRKKQKNDERRRNLTLVGVVGLIVVLLIGGALTPVIKDWLNKREYQDKSVTSIGAAASVCQDITTKPADGEQEHVEPGTELKYENSPPAFGKHYNVWEPIGTKFYSTKNRPDLGYLVHNLEHGYTILWYDETAAKDDDMMGVIKGLATKYDTDDANYRNKFKAAPWTSEDGDPFPEGQHIALTHWSVGGTTTPRTDTSKSTGVTQFCSEPSGEALESFMQKYPYMDSPEPLAI